MRRARSAGRSGATRKFNHVFFGGRYIHGVSVFFSFLDASDIKMIHHLDMLQFFKGIFDFIRLYHLLKSIN